MLSEKFIDEFAAEWIASWNSHDIERILSHYEETFEFSSPVLAKVSPASGGKLIGKDAARAYWCVFHAHLDTDSTRTWTVIP